MKSPILQNAGAHPGAFDFPGADGFGLVSLRNRAGIEAQFLPSGACFAWRHGPTLINQLLPGPAEDGLFRLLLRWRDSSQRGGWASLVAAGETFARAGPGGATWRSSPHAGLICETRVQLHPTIAGWIWRVRVENRSSTELSADVLFAQDLGLADAGAVRNNEAYVSHYIDLLPLADQRFGTAILARQNQPMAGGHHPWLGVACLEGAAAWCTDGWQFFGGDHRLTGEPAAVRAPSLPSRRLQYEFALAGLQTHAVTIAPGGIAHFTFLLRYLEDHPGASGPPDLRCLAELLPLRWVPPTDITHRTKRSPSVFTTAPWCHGAEPTAQDWERWFPGERRHVETDADGRILSFFHGEDTHVVSRTKEARVARPHGHVLRSGNACWIDDEQFGLTCYAAGIFAAQSYLGNPSLARLLSVVRNHLNVARAHGQRVFVRIDDTWTQLGVPSAFVMQPRQVRWIYRLAAATVEARVWCADELPASFLELRMIDGPPGEFLITHQLALGANEFEGSGRVEVDPGGWCICQPAPDVLAMRHRPGLGFAIAVADPECGAEIGGDEWLYADAVRRHGPYVAIRTRASSQAGIIMLGSNDGTEPLADLVARARAAFAGSPGAAAVPPLRLRLQLPGDAAVARVDEVLPWFHHDASIHFSAPHGLEQYGGAAWGVRDVCQGSMEWLLANGEFAIARRVLETVFAQQYPGDGSWPQWFMHPPFRFMQQAHSHGDVCFWPVKALCDYVEATNDLALMQQTIGYTDAKRFESVGPSETLWEHCERVIAHAESRFVPGTALVNYGDGDWDDTLQPADPTMRTRMISAWTVALAYQVFRQLATVAARSGRPQTAACLEDLLTRMRRDFHERLMPGGIAAGFLVMDVQGARPLLHPDDHVTGIRYRLLPMTRAVLAELFTGEEVRRHLAIVEQELRFPDGVRLMSDPAVYRGGLEHWFKRADTAANVGREIGLQYVHAHLRYAEALARVGDAEGLWWALQVVNPVGLQALVPNAVLRQSNVYFSSSDADFADRYEASDRWAELRSGRVAVRGGWRLYSSGPGLFLHKVRSCLLGVRESFGEVVFDPVLPKRLDGLTATVELYGRPARMRYRVRHSTHSPRNIIVNGIPLAGVSESNPYRPGGRRISASELASALTRTENEIEIAL